MIWHVCDVSVCLCAWCFLRIGVTLAKLIVWSCMWCCVRFCVRLVCLMCVGCDLL